MILLDTHIWIWWIVRHQRLTEERRQWLLKHETTGLGVSIISCWEITKLIEKNRLQFSCSIDEWFEQALKYPGIRLLELTLPIVLDAFQLPPPFHSDPADQLIVATARVHDIPLLTADRKILDYSHVQTIKP
jgi:PIN domain nuclease of toxin-antitoxin system